LKKRGKKTKKEEELQNTGNNANGCSKSYNIMFKRSKNSMKEEDGIPSNKKGLTDINLKYNAITSKVWPFTAL
jgi:hypothetical protein